MVLFNYSTKELTAKIVYYGPGLCGKTTNLQYIHGNLPDTVKGKMLSLATKTDRTLFFDFLPIDLGEIRGMKTRVQLYTVPGQVFYNETRKLVLKGADGIIFVADSQEQMLSANVESFKNLEENLKGHGLSLADMPHAIQFNKRDLPNLASIEQLNSAINKYNAPFYETVATTGIGVQDTLKAITKLVLLHLTKKYDPSAASAPEAASAAPKPAAPQAPAPTPEIAAPAAETQAIPIASVPSVEPDQPIAVAQPSAPAVAASIETAEPQFEDSEIDDLVGEVEEIDDIPAPAPNPFAIDSSSLSEETPVAELPTVDDEPAKAEPEVAAAPSMEVDADFGIDVNTDPEPAVNDVHEIPEIDDPMPIEQPAAAAEPEAPASSDEVVLTEVASDDALFNDPNLDVARIEEGAEREIVVPVEMGSGDQLRRFKLSIRLRVDAVSGDDK